MLAILSALAGDLNGLADSLHRVAVASEFSWVRTVIAYCIVAGSAVRIGLPIYDDWRRTHSGGAVSTKQGPVSYKRACELAMEENITLEMRSQALERRVAKVSDELAQAKEENIALQARNHELERELAQAKAARSGSSSGSLGDPGVGE